MSSPPAPNRQPRRLRLAAVLALVLGLVIAGVSAAPIVRAFSDSFIDTLNSPVYTAPFDQFVTLDAGVYLLYESEDANAEVRPDAVQVADPTGNPLSSIRRSGGNDTVDRGSERFVNVVRFTASRSGRYRIGVIDPPQARFLVGRDPGDAFARAAAWFAGVGIGAMLLLLGFILLILSFSGGRSSRRAPVLVYYGQQQQQWAAPPPGWYPDPQQSAGWRYWDGYRWQP